MAQTKKKRRRKHSGTQAGTVRRQTRERRPATKQEKREEARRRRIERLDRPPTLRGSLTRAGVAAAVFVGVVIILFGRPLIEGLALGAFMFLLYIPVSYYTDLFIYRRRQKKKEGQRAERRDSRDGRRRG